MKIRAEFQSHLRGRKDGNSGHRYRSILLWISAIVASAFGFAPLVNIGLIGDDFVVLSNGMGYLWGTGGLLEYTLDSIADMTTSEHVLPIGSVATVFYVKVVELLAATPLTFGQAWGLMRVVMILLSVLAATAFVAVWLKLATPQMPQTPHRNFIIFSLLSSFTIAFTGIHALWTYDPVLSYALAGWGTTTLVFMFLTFLGKAINSYEARSQKLWSLATAAIGIVGILFYEMFAAGLFAGVASLFFIALLIPGRRAVAGRLHILLGVLTPSAIFLLIQFWRLRQPRDYSGTSTGFQDLVIPVWINSSLGNFPLTTFRALQEEIGSFDLEIVPALPQSAVSIFLLLTAGWVAQTTSLRTSLASASNLGKVLVVISLVTVVFALAASGIFSVSSKYQVDIGMTLGNIYLAYAPGLLGLSILVLLGGLLLLRISILVWLLVLIVIIVPVGLLQWSLNHLSLDELHQRYEWTGQLLTEVESPKDEDFRCFLLNNLNRRDVPTWYRANSIEGLNNAILGRHSTYLCDGGN